MTIPSDFKELLPVQHVAHDGEPDDRPTEYLWVYDPQTQEVHVESGEGDHPAHFPTHQTMCPHVTHPERLQGYAYSIKGGWRVGDEFGHKVEDAYILKRIQRALRNEHPLPPLPHVRYHGDPSRHR